MSTFTTLLTIPAILPAILSASLEPPRWGHEIDYGVLTNDYIPSFVGERPVTSPDGDYVRATFCYCKTRLDPLKRRLWISQGNRDGEHSGGGGIEPGEIVQGHYWRYEYFNYHDNATYFLNHYCTEDAFPADRYGCGYDSPGRYHAGAG